MATVSFESIAPVFEFGDPVIVAGKQARFVEYYLQHDESHYARVIFGDRLYSESVLTKEITRAEIDTHTVPDLLGTNNLPHHPGGDS